MTDYHGSTFTYTYYDDGRLSTVTAPGNKTWVYGYGALGQMTGVSIPNQPWGVCRLCKDIYGGCPTSVGGRLPRGKNQETSR